MANIKLAGLASNMDTDTIVQQLMSAHSLKKTKIENKITKLEWKQEKWKNLNTKIYSLYTGSLSKVRMQGNYMTKKATTSNETAAKVTASNTAADGSYSLSIKSLASSQYITGAKMELDSNSSSKKLSSSTTLVDGLGMAAGTTINVNGEKNGFTVTEKTTVNDFVSYCKRAGVNASFDETQGRIFLSSKSSGAGNGFAIAADTGNAVGTDGNPITTTSDDQLSKLGLGVITLDTDGKPDYSSASANMTVEAAADAVFTLNGAEMTSSSNTATVNGLTMQLQEVTSSPMTITVSNDTDAVYNMIKTFISDYNDVLSTLNDAYYADSARGYDPLTDDEKEAMTDTEVEKWEDKIKNGLLRRDDKLGSLLSSMKTTMTSSVEINGKKYSLASFGIGSALYTEKGKLHIDGDSDDALVADQTDKLRTALEEDPDTVMKVISTLAGNLYSTMQEKMKTTTLSSALTFYNDKEMATTLTKYKKELSEMEDKLQDIEDRYYSQFTAMETAMANLNSQTSALSSMLGY